MHGARRAGIAVSIVEIAVALDAADESARGPLVAVGALEEPSLGRVADVDGQIEHKPGISHHDHGDHAVEVFGVEGRVLGEPRGRAAQQHVTDDMSALYVTNQFFGRLVPPVLNVAYTCE